MIADVDQANEPVLMFDLIYEQAITCNMALAEIRGITP